MFATGTKSKPDHVVGTQLIQEIRPLTDKPIVAIGGITLARALEIIESGADSVAVISDILGAPAPGMRPTQYIHLLGPANHPTPGRGNSTNCQHHASPPGPQGQLNDGPCARGCVVS